MTELELLMDAITLSALLTVILTIAVIAFLAGLCVGTNLAAPAPRRDQVTGRFARRSF